ncbi:hypothetical protein [Propionimicrobium sp. PCR01-08-3]|uniref:hypothetical protein n=1 Tax=Propionimicrobium sp. PCR01-08-3 TaxID=3052086 RepID=UPI00255C6431|nr:hypothetical protein [Propionimicrobium sp. PCR01-08-3]WIY84060.1 hypothetical protein QQ658_06905 [Propionimicrobium sp. PCR01-08-3]
MRVLLDNSVLRRRNNEAVALEIRTLDADDSVELMSCPPQVLEFCFSAQQGVRSYDVFRDVISGWTPLLHTPSVETVLELQRKLWEAEKYRAAGAMDTLIAAWALVNDTSVVHYDRDFVHLASVIPEFKQAPILPFGSI